MAAQGEQTGRYKVSNGKTAWLPVLLVLIVPLLGGFVGFGLMQGQLNAQEKDIQENGEAIASTPQIFVPRNELDAKLQNIELQVEAVQKSVDAYASQSERQTAEIIRRIERIDRPPP